jgi:hypothetical protein
MKKVSKKQPKVPPEPLPEESLPALAKRSGKRSAA